MRLYKRIRWPDPKKGKRGYACVRCNTVHWAKEAAERHTAKCHGSGRPAAKQPPEPNTVEPPQPEE